MAAGELHVNATYAQCTDRGKVFIRSRAPYSVYKKQFTLIRSRTFLSRTPSYIGQAIRSEQDTQRNSAIRSREFRVGQPAIQIIALETRPIAHRYSACRYSKQAPRIAISRFGQWCEIKARLLKYEIEPTINKALIKMITDPLRLAELFLLLFRIASLPYSEQFISSTHYSKFLEKHSQIVIIRSSRSQMFLRLGVPKNYAVFTGKLTGKLRNVHRPEDLQFY